VVSLSLDLCYTTSWDSTARFRLYAAASPYFGRKIARPRRLRPESSVNSTARPVSRAASSRLPDSGALAPVTLPGMPSTLAGVTWDSPRHARVRVAVVVPSGVCPISH